MIRRALPLALLALVLGMGLPRAAEVRGEDPVPPAVIEAPSAPEPAPQSGPVAAQERYYTVVAGDGDPDTLVARMGVVSGDPYREILVWNPQLRNPYDLRVGQILRVPGFGPAPAWPAFTQDFSQWKPIAEHTSSFWGSPSYRVENIIVGANTVNNFFDDWRHPYLLPRDSMSLNWLLGDITLEKGYRWGHAIAMIGGVARDIPAIGGGICQLPSTVFPAALKAGLDVTDRQNHSYYPYFYWKYPEGFGWDATISPPTPYQTDLVIRNMYDYPVRILFKADLAAQTLTTTVWGPPELVPYPVTIDGPYLITGHQNDPEPFPTSKAGWVWWSAHTVVTQRMDLRDGSDWARTFHSYYARDPYR